MFKTAACLAFILSIVPLVDGQEVGSPEAARFLAKQANDQIQSEIRWKSAKKLSLDPLAEPPTKQPEQDGSLYFSDVSTGDVGMMIYWQFQVQSIIDKNNLQLRLAQHTFWLEDFPTAGLADGDNVHIIDPVRVTESRAYTTVTGAKRTVKALKMISKQEYSKHLAELADKQALVDREKRRANSDTFTFADGSGSLRARFFDYDYKKSVAIFEDVEGKKVEHPLASFDKSTAAKIRDLYKKAPKEPASKKKK